MSMELREEARRREWERGEWERRREELAGDLRSLAVRPEGRRFFRWLIDQGNIFAEDYQPGCPGAYRAGMKASSVRLWRLLREQLPAGIFAEVVMGGDGAAGVSFPEEAGEPGTKETLDAGCGAGR